MAGWRLLFALYLQSPGPEPDTHRPPRPNDGISRHDIKIFTFCLTYLNRHQTHSEQCVSAGQEQQNAVHTVIHALHYLHLRIKLILYSFEASSLNAGDTSLPQLSMPPTPRTAAAIVR